MRAILVVVPFLVGCGTTHDLVKDVEGKAYDSLGKAFQEYCQRRNDEGLVSSVVDRERLEARREVRQRVGGGPVGPENEVPGLDEKTAHGKGPVVRVYCEGERVPEEVWRDFVRVK